VFVLEQPVLPLDISVLHQHALTLDVSLQQQYVLSLDVSVLEQHALPLDMSLLQQSVLSLHVSVLHTLQQSVLPRRVLHAASRRVYPTAACAACGRVLSVLQQPRLPSGHSCFTEDSAAKGLICTADMLPVRVFPTAASAVLGLVWSTTACAAPVHVCSTAACDAFGHVCPAAAFAASGRICSKADLLLGCVYL
jgi:hypothetical protein